jgi:carboxymethylenebutenolidase
MPTLVEEHADIETPSGPMRLHVWRPNVPGLRFPCVVLYSEIFQVSGPIRRTCADLAGQGFLVAAPEVYHESLPAGTALAYDPEGTARGNALKVEKEVAAYDADAAAAVAWLAGHPLGTGRVGAMGICLGGGLAFRAALHPLVKATATVYGTDLHKRSLGKGMNDDSLARAAEVKGAMCMIWGRQDPHVPREGRRVIYDAISDAGITFEWHEFNGVHAFMRDESSFGRYDPELATLSQTVIFAFFRRYLGGNLEVIAAAEPAAGGAAVAAKS